MKCPYLHKIRWYRVDKNNAKSRSVSVLFILHKGQQSPRSTVRTGRVSLCFPAVITGQQRGGVISARTRINVLLDSFRKKQPFTHFLSFALNQPVVQEKFLQFKEEVLEKCSQVRIRVRAPARENPFSSVSFTEGGFCPLPQRFYSLLPFLATCFQLAFCWSWRLCCEFIGKPIGMQNGLVS